MEESRWWTPWWRTLCKEHLCRLTHKQLRYITRYCSLESVDSFLSEKKKMKVSWSVPMWQVTQSDTVISCWAETQTQQAETFTKLPQLPASTKRDVWTWQKYMNAQDPTACSGLSLLTIKQESRPHSIPPTHSPSTLWLQSSNSQSPGSKSPPDTVTSWDRSDTSHPILVINQVDLLFRQLEVSSIPVQPYNATVGLLWPAVTVVLQE